MGDNNEAAYFGFDTSLELVVKNIYLGNILANNITGATIEANLAFEKNTDIKKLNVISDNVNKK